MSIQTLNRCGIALCLTVIVSGCSTPGGSPRSTECVVNRSACMHEGSYEEGEEAFAEEEAKRLNRASSRKMRRSSWW